MELVLDADNQCAQPDDDLVRAGGLVGPGVRVIRPCLSDYYRSGWAKPLSLLFACYLSWHATSAYEARQPYVRELRLQQAALEQRFAQGGQELPPHSFCILLNMSPDLHPDPVIKHLIPQGAAMSDVLFLNPRNGVMGVVTNDQEPADGAPFVIAELSQEGYFEMGSYRAYTLAYVGNASTAEPKHAGGRKPLGFYDTSRSSPP